MNLGVPRRGQRWLLVVLALALAGAAAFCFLRSSAADEEATAQAVSSAEAAARGIGARLLPEDLSGTMGSSHAASVSAYVHRRFLEADQTVMVWDEDAVVVFADDVALIGTQDQQEQDRIARVLSDGTRTQQTESSLHVFAPAPVGEDGSETVVAEIALPATEIDAAGRTWLYGSMGAALAALLVLAAALRRGAGGRSSSGFAASDPRDVRALRIERQRVERMEHELHDAREAEARVRAELDTVTTSLRDVQRTVSERDEQHQRLETDLRAVRSELSSLKGRNEELSRRSMEARAGAAQAVEATARAQADPVVDSAFPSAPVPEPFADPGPAGSANGANAEELDRLRRSLRHAEHDAASERESRMALDGRVSELQEVREMLEAALETTGSEAEAARAELAATAQTYREEAEAARREVQRSAEARAADAEAARSQLEQNIRQLAATDEALEVARRETEEARTQIAAAESAAAASTSETAARIEELRTRLADARDELERSKAEAQPVRSDLETARAETERLREEHEGAREEGDTASEQRDGLRADALIRTAEIEALRSEANARTAELEALRAEAEGHEAEMEALRAEVAERNAELDALRAQGDGARSEAEAARAEAEAVRADLDAIRAGFDAARTELETAHAEADAARTELEAVRDTSDARDEVESLRAEADAMRAELEAARTQGEATLAELEEGRREFEERTRVPERAMAEQRDRFEEELQQERERSERALADERAEAQRALEEERTRIQELGSSQELDPTMADMAEQRSRADRAEAELAAERAHADELARTVEVLGRQAEDLARQSAEEATTARTRLLDTQEALAQFQERLERSDAGGDPASEVAIARDAAGEVIDAISTDAKRSLSTIFGLARAIGAGPEADQTPLVQQLMTQLKRMEHAVGDLIEADQLARGEVQLNRRSTEIDTLLRRVTRQFPHPGDRRIDVAVETATIQVDPARLERLVDDLLTTAVGRTNAGDRIVLRLTRVESGVVISVEDGKPEGTVGAAAEFIARLHGGWTDVEALPDGSSAVRAFLPTVWTSSSEPTTPVGGSDDLETASSDEAEPADLGSRLSSTR